MKAGEDRRKAGPEGGAGFQTISIGSFFAAGRRGSLCQRKRTHF